MKVEITNNGVLIKNNKNTLFQNPHQIQMFIEELEKAKKILIDKMEKQHLCENHFWESL